RIVRANARASSTAALAGTFWGYSPWYERGNCKGRDRQELPDRSPLASRGEAPRAEREAVIVAACEALHIYWGRWEGVPVFGPESAPQWERRGRDAPKMAPKWETPRINVQSQRASLGRRWLPGGGPYAFLRFFSVL